MIKSSEYDGRRWLNSWWMWWIAQTVCEQAFTGFILWMHPANERWCYIVTPSLIGWVHSQNDPCIQCAGEWLPEVFMFVFEAWHARGDKWGQSQYKSHQYRGLDGLIFTMVIPIPGKDSLYIEMGPWYPLIWKSLSCAITESKSNNQYLE